MDAAILTSRMRAAGLLLAKTKQPEVLSPKSQTEPRETKTKVKVKARPELFGIKTPAVQALLTD